MVARSTLSFCTLRPPFFGGDTPPHVFIGTATIDGVFPPSGTVITALIDGAGQGSTTVGSGGKYGPLMVAQGSSTDITFMIGNLPLARLPPWSKVERMSST